MQKKVYGLNSFKNRFRGYRCVFALWAVTCLAIGLLLQPAQAKRAQAGELAVFCQDLTRDFLNRVNEETGAEAPLRQEVMSRLVAQMQRSLLGTDKLNKLSPKVSVLSLQPALGSYFKKLELLGVCQCYAQASGRYEDFVRIFIAYAQSRQHRYNYKDPKIKAQINTIYKKLVFLDSMYACVGSAGRFVEDGWSGDVKVSWYPLRGTVYIYTVCSMPDGRVVKSAVLSIAGSVTAAPATWERKVTLSSGKLSLSLSSKSYIGSWTAPQAMSFSRLESLFLSGRIRLQIKGNEVAAKLTEEVASVDSNGASVRGTLEYVLGGRMDKDGIISGSYSVTGPGSILALRLGKASANGGTWFGRCTPASVIGSLKLSDGQKLDFTAAPQ